MSSKNFKTNNPAFSYLTANSEQPNKQETKNMNQTQENIVENKLNIETKSKRLNLLIQPSLYNDVTKIATISRVSNSELISIALREYVSNNQSKISKFNETFENK